MTVFVLEHTDLARIAVEILLRSTAEQKIETHSRKQLLIKIKKPPHEALAELAKQSHERRFSYLVFYNISLFVIEMIFQKRVSVTWYDFYPFFMLKEPP